MYLGSLDLLKSEINTARIKMTQTLQFFSDPTSFEMPRWFPQIFHWESDDFQDRL